MKAGCMRLLGLAVVLAVMAGDGIGVEEKQGEKKKKLPAIAADVIKVEIDDEEGDFVTSEDEKMIPELLAFFSELGQMSNDSGADWPSTHVLKFLRKNGECFRIDIHISSKMNCWSSMGLGDWPLKEPDGLKKVINSFFKKKEKKKAEKKETAAGAGPWKVSDVIADSVKVEIQRAANRGKRRTREQSVTIEDKEKIAALLAFFPEMGELSKRRGLWVADYHIKCILKKGDPIEIRVSWDLKWWTDRAEEIAHWRLKDPEKFEKLIDDWIKKK